MITAGITMLVCGVCGVLTAALAPLGRAGRHLAILGLTAMVLGAIALAIPAWIT